MTRLFVNVDHVATIREARKTVEPDPLLAAQTARKAGADGITVHLREDRRHIQDHDVERIRAAINIPLNLEMAPVEEMVQIALGSGSTNRLNRIPLSASFSFICMSRSICEQTSSPPSVVISWRFSGTSDT